MPDSDHRPLHAERINLIAATFFTLLAIVAASLALAGPLYREQRFWFAVILLAAAAPMWLAWALLYRSRLGRSRRPRR